MNFNYAIYSLSLTSELTEFISRAYQANLSLMVTFFHIVCTFFLFLLLFFIVRFIFGGFIFVTMSNTNLYKNFIHWSSRQNIEWARQITALLFFYSISSLESHFIEYCSLIFLFTIKILIGDSYRLFTLVYEYFIQLSMVESKESNVSLQTFF